MIRRLDRDSFLLISQVEHARLSGQLARRIGNSKFAPASPYQEVIAAIDLHDEGWPARDLHPIINPQGSPEHVFESDIHDPMILQIWDKSVDHAAAVSPYSGLLASLHVLGISIHAISRRSDLKEDSMRQVVFKYNQFQHRQIERQEMFRKTLQMRIDLPLRAGLAEMGRAPEEDLLLRNFSLVQLTDRVSLVLCFNEPIFRQVDQIYARMGELPMELEITHGNPNGVQIYPWPFDADQLNFVLPAIRLPAKVYASDAELQHAFACASEESVEVKLFR